MRILAAGLVLGLLGAAPAQAGVRVSWPERTTLEPGDAVGIVVRSSTPVRVALLRLSSRGVPVRTIAARRLRRGRFVATLPEATVTVRYLLAVDAGSRRRSRVIEAVPPAPLCDTAARTVAQLDVPATLAPGQRFTMTLRNAGRTCFSYGAHLLHEVWRDGRWERYREPGPSPSWARGLAPGQSDVLDGWLPEDWEPGHYRIAYPVAGPEGEVVAHDEFDVR